MNSKLFRRRRAEFDKTSRESFPEQSVACPSAQTSFVNLVFALSWLSLGPPAPIALWFILLHLGLAVLPWLAARRGLPGPIPFAALLELHPLPLIALAWTEIGLRHRYVVARPHDLLVSRVELGLFGFHPHELALHFPPTAWVMEAMNGVYFGYYLLLVGIPLLVLLGGCRVGIRRMVTRLAVGYLGTFLLYLLFPVDGPQDAFPESIVRVASTGFAAVNATIRTAGDSLGTAFPSSHVVGTITLAWIACEAAPPWTRLPALLLAALVPPATVYTQNHYGLDALAGILVALLLHGLIVPLIAGRPAPVAEAS